MGTERTFEEAENEIKCARASHQYYAFTVHNINYLSAELIVCFTHILSSINHFYNAQVHST